MALVVAMVALVAWWVIPVLAVIPVGLIGLLALTAFLVVATYPGRTALRRDPFATNRHGGGRRPNRQGPMRSF